MKMKLGYGKFWVYPRFKLSDTRELSTILFTFHHPEFLEEPFWEKSGQNEGGFNSANITGEWRK